MAVIKSSGFWKATDVKRVSLKLIISAFITLTVLIAAQTAGNIYQLSRTQARINTIVALHNHKIDVITRTQVAAHMRTDRLLRMVIEDDPFMRDDLFLEFNRAGYLVGSGRNELRRIGLNPQQQASFDKQSALIQKIEAAQEAVTDLVLSDQTDAARALLVERAAPLQESLNVLLAELRELVQRDNDAALIEARNAYQQSWQVTLVSGAAATVLGMLLGWFTLTRAIANRRRIQQQMSELETSRAALQIEATHDPLTGLANRRLFYDRLEQALMRARRYKHKVGVLFVDLDRFKYVNDRYGHHVGDALLIEIAGRLSRSVRESDTVARSGGDEFMVVLDHLQDSHDCEAIIRQIESSLEGGVTVFGQKFTLTASIGQAIYPDDGANEDDLVRAADASMYDIKTGMHKSAQ
jgi:diguanylate cyclase (GGDEF)-like protein